MTRSMKVTKHYTQANQHSGCCRYLQLVFFPYNTDLHFANKHLHQYTYKKKKNHVIAIQQKNKTYTMLDPTLKQVIVHLHSSAAAYIHTHAHAHTVHSIFCAIKKVKTEGQ